MTHPLNPRTLYEDWKTVRGARMTLSVALHTETHHLHQRIDIILTANDTDNTL